MSNTNSHNEDDSNDHSDCQDCKRQKKQNQALISIYQRLQNVHSKVGSMQQSIKLHKQSSLNNNRKVKNLQQKVQIIKNVKNTQDEQQFQNIGYQLFAQMIEQQQKSKYFKENQRLKKVLKHIYQQKILNKSTIKGDNMNSYLSFSQNVEENKKNSHEWFNQSSFLSKNADPCTPREIQSGKLTEVFSTKSSFNTTKRKTFNLKEFQELNLWLFENQNQKLQKQLYQPTFAKRYSNPEELLFQTKSFNLNQKSSRFTFKNNGSRMLKNISFRSSSLHQNKNTTKQREQISVQKSPKSPKIPEFNKSKLIFDKQMLNLNINHLNKEQQKQKAESYFTKRIKGNIRGSVLPAIGGQIPIIK